MVLGCGQLALDVGVGFSKLLSWHYMELILLSLHLLLACHILRRTWRVMPATHTTIPTKWMGFRDSSSHHKVEMVRMRISWREGVGGGRKGEERSIHRRAVRCPVQDDGSTSHTLLERLKTKLIVYNIDRTFDQGMSPIFKLLWLGLCSESIATGFACKI